MSGSSGPPAFGGLLGTFASADAAAGGPVAAAGSRAGSSGDEQDNKPKQPLRVPPQPSPPVRMPRKTHHLLDMSSSACSLASSSVCSSASSSRASLSGLFAVSAAGTAGNEHAVGAAALAVSLASLAGSDGGLAPLAEAPAPGALGGAAAQATEESRGSSDICDTGGAVVSFAGLGLFSRGSRVPSSKSSAASEAGSEEADRQDRKKSRDLSDYSGYCCFRDGRKPRRSSSSNVAPSSTAGATSSPCEAIREDRPETFSRDVALLELRSLLRSHAVEPSDALVGDLLRWQVGAMKASSLSAAPGQ